MLGTLFDSQAQSRYTTLPEVELAYAELSTRYNQFTSFLNEFLSLVLDNSIQQWVGVFLLHRHFDFGFDELLIERPTILISGTKALVTAPSKAKGVPFAPTRWAVDSGQLVPLEFSEDDEAITISRNLAGYTEFTSEFAALVSDHQFEQLIGLTITPRAFLPLQFSEQYVERTYVEGSALTVEPAGALDKELIPTSWSAVEERHGTAPRMGCMSLCTVTGGRPDVPGVHRKTGHMPI